MIKKLNQKIVYQNKWMTMYEDAIEFSNGTQGIYGYVKRNDGAVALVLNSNEEVLLIKQYRYPIHDWEWELPGGAIDEGEEPTDAIKREVEEETGLIINSVEEIAKFYPLSSCSAEKNLLFLAKVEVNSPILKNSQGDEDMNEMKFVTVAEALHMIDKGLITDAYTCNALQILARRMSESQ